MCGRIELTKRRIISDNDITSNISDTESIDDSGMGSP
jgi:hypothetical protein